MVTDISKLLEDIHGFQNQRQALNEEQYGRHG
jgi:hypothetical protein